MLPNEYRDAVGEHRREADPPAPPGPNPPKVRSYADEVLCTAMDFGEGLLKCGAEVRRVEDTVIRICHAYGAEHVEIFAITAMITAAIRMPDGDYSSQVRRVYGSDNDFLRLEDFNELSRRICRETPPIEEVQESLRKIRENGKPIDPVVFIGGTVAAASFAVFFGGGVFDAVASGVIGFLMILLGSTLFSKMGPFARTLLNSVFAGLLAETAAHLYGGFHADKIMIATIMLLIPGSSFCNSLRDLFSGDTFAGSARLMQSVLLALTIAAGFSLAILLFGGVIL